MANKFILNSYIFPLCVSVDVCATPSRLEMWGMLIFLLHFHNLLLQKLALLFKDFTFQCDSRQNNFIWREHTLEVLFVSSSIPLRVKYRSPAIDRGGPRGSGRPQIFLTFRHYKGGRSSAKCTGRLYPRRNPWYSLLASIPLTYTKCELVCWPLPEFKHMQKKVGVWWMKKQKMKHTHVCWYHNLNWYIWQLHHS